MNLLWKLAIVLSILVGFFAVWDNGRRVHRLEAQVCMTVQESNDRTKTLAYYEEHPDERDEILAANKIVLRRFHCPIEIEGD